MTQLSPLYKENLKVKLMQNLFGHGYLLFNGKSSIKIQKVFIETSYLIEFDIVIVFFKENLKFKLMQNIITVTVISLFMENLQLTLIPNLYYI